MRFPAATPPKSVLVATTTEPVQPSFPGRKVSRLASAALEPEVVPAPEALSPNVAFTAFMAREMGWLQVSCFVGEEYDGIDDVQNGWFSLVTPERAGLHHLAPLLEITEAILHWDAPDGVDEATCEVEKVKYAELVVDIEEHDGRPAAGAGVIGCGGAGHDTPADGRTSFIVLADQPPCVLEVARYAPSTGLYSVAFHRTGTLAENEQRHIRIRLTDYDGAEGIGFNGLEYLDHEDGDTWVPERTPQPTAQERHTARLRDLDFNAKWLAALERAKEAIPEAAEQIDPKLKRARIREQAAREALEAE